MIEIEKSKHKIPPTRVLHGRDANVSKDISIENLTLIVGGRNLLEESRLHLPYGKKIRFSRTKWYWKNLSFDSSCTRRFRSIKKKCSNAFS